MDTAVRLAAALDWEHGGRRLVELADRFDRTEAAIRRRASRLGAGQLETVTGLPAVEGACRDMPRLVAALRARDQRLGPGVSVEHVA